MAQQGQIMKMGAGYVLLSTTGSTTNQALSPGCRYVRVTASAPMCYGVGATQAAATAMCTSGTGFVYHPGTTYGPDLIDVDGTPFISARGYGGGTGSLFITELSA